MVFSGLHQRLQLALLGVLATVLCALSLGLEAQAGALCATPSEEALIAKGFIFFPARVVCPPEPASQVTKVAPPTNEPVATAAKTTQTTATPRPAPEEKRLTTAPKPAETSPSPWPSLSTQSFEASKPVAAIGSKPSDEAASRPQEKSLAEGKRILRASLPEFSLGSGLLLKSTGEGIVFYAPANERELFTSGIGRMRVGSREEWLWNIRWAKYLSDTNAIGLSAEAGSNHLDLTANSWLTDPSQSWSLFSSLGYMRGSQEFDFFAGKASTTLAQTSALLDLGYSPEWTQGAKLNLIGWSASTSQPSSLSAATVVQSSANRILTYSDQRALALGGVRGGALGLELPLGENVTFSQRIGSERYWLRHSDGTQETTDSRYQLSSLKYMHEQHWGELSFQQGASGQTTSLTHQTGNWRFTYTSVTPKEAAPSHRSYGVAYNINLDGDAERRSASGQSSFAREPSAALERRSTLERLASRPTQFPKTFSAKVDRDNVRLVSQQGAPTADAGPDQSVSSAAAVTLTGLGSTDPDNDTLTYVWAQTSGTAVTLSDTTAAQPTFTAPTLNVGDPATTLTFSLTVADGTFTSSADTVTVTVGAPAEVITWASTGQVGEYFDFGSPSRQSVNVQLSASSNSGGAITYDTTLASGSLPPGVNINAAGLISGSTTAVLTTTDYTFTVTVTSATGGSSVSGPLTIKVRQPVLLQWTTAGVTVLKGDADTAATSTNTSFTTPTSLTSVELLLVGGGGGGGWKHGGGGGGGTVVINSSHTLTAATTYAIGVGSGGAGATNTTRIGESGSSTTFGVITASGGGGGGGGLGGFERGLSGGSGGGVSPDTTTVPVAGGAECGTTEAGFTYFCNAGGADSQIVGYKGTGGGGAGGVGQPQTTTLGGAGGAGYEASAALGSGFFAGGGGGGSWNGTGDAAGGSGVGGAGSSTGVGGAAVANTGSGGGGGSESAGGYDGGNGADGLVFLRY